MAKARDKFQPGDRVQFSAYGEATFPRRRLAKTGVVVGFGHEVDIVRVRADGARTATSYHMDFWEARKDLEQL